LSHSQLITQSSCHTVYVMRKEEMEELSVTGKTEGKGTEKDNG